MSDKRINDRAAAFLEATLWVWLPFAALWRLTRDVINKHSGK